MRPLLLSLCATAAIACTRKPTLKEMTEHPARELATWGGVPDTPLEERVVHPVPEMILDYVRKDNVFKGYRERPRPAQVDPAVLDDLRTALRELPEQVRRLVAAKLVAICPIEELGGSAYVERLRDRGDEEAGAWMLVDTSVLDRRANAWATWRENTPFLADPAHRLEATIEAPESDTRKHALQYILLHELGHVAAFGRDAVPEWWRPPKHAYIDKYEFFVMSWRAKNGEFVSIFDDVFPRAEVKYYMPESYRSLPAARAVEIYRALERTSFPSLYGATNHQDDFAEGFVTYVHTVMQGRPFEVRMYDRDQLVHSYHACWDEPRCAEKKLYFADLLDPEPLPLNR